MFDPTSRYFRVSDATYTGADGRTILYKQRRLPPQGSSFTARGEVNVQPADRLDLIAARTLGDPLQFWRIADANDALDPFDLLEQRTLTIPLVKA